MPASSENKDQTAQLIASEPDLAEAKIRFLKAAEDFSPLGVVRKRPFASIGIAFMAGFGLSSIGGSRTAPPALDTVASLASLAARFVPLFLTRARSSDG